MEDTPGYREVIRMTHDDFLEILRLIEPDITTRQVTGGHKVISAAERLTPTIRFLGTGETYRSLSFQSVRRQDAVSMDTSRLACVARMRSPNMFYTVVQTNKTSPIKHENKRNVSNCLIECLMVFKFYQTRPKTIKLEKQRRGSRPGPDIGIALSIMRQ